MKKSIFKNPVLKYIIKIISWIIMTILIVVAAFLIYYVISSKIYESKGQKFEPSFSLYTIISGSMEPNIHVYDVVFTQKIKDFSTIKKNDIITFISTSTLSEGSTVTHRVIDIVKTEDGYKFRTQGDNNEVADTSLVSEENVLGKVLFKIPQLGRIQFLLQRKGGWIIVLLIPAAIILIYDVIKVMRLSSTKKLVDTTLTNEEQAEEEERKKRKEKEEKLKNEITKRNKIKEEIKEVPPTYKEKEEEKKMTKEKFNQEIYDYDKENDDFELPKRKSN